MKKADPSPKSTPDPAPTLRLSEFLPYRLSVLSNTVSSAIADAYSERFGLTIWQWRCMAVIGETPGLASRDVAARTAMDKVAVSRAVSGLEALGHVVRKADETDRRASRLTLTPTGEGVYREIVPLALGYEASLIAELDSTELEQLQKILEKLARAAAPGDRPLW